MPMRQLLVCLCAAAILTAGATPARADTFLTAYLGSMFNGNVDGADPGHKLHYGAAVTAMGGSGLGFGLDFSYAPTFFTSGDDELFNFASDGNLVTLMGNLVVGRPRGAVRPYGSGGLGLMKSRISGPLDLAKYDHSGFGLDAGGGVLVGAGPLAVALDVRYYRQISDLASFVNLELGTLSFWRGSVGVVLGF